MKKIVVYGIPAMLMLIGLVASACAPAPAAPAATTAPKQPAPAAKESWQQEWDRLLQAAQKEGQIVLYSSSGSVVTAPMTKHFSDKYGINLEWVSATTAQLEERIYRERRAGLYQGDAYFSGTSAVLFGEKVMDSLDNFLFLPEVVDKKAWWGGNLIFIDDEHTWAGLLAYPISPIFYNTNLVKPEEVRSYNNFLEPKWKQKIVLFNPRTGGGLDWVYHVSEVVMSRDYLAALAKQEPIIVNDARQQVEWVAQGKYPVALGGRGENKAEFVRLGAPVAMTTPVEGTNLTSGAAGVGIFLRPPHPNGAKLFVNWAMSKEGGALISKLIGGHSARLDVPTDFLEPAMVRQPDVKYFNTITAAHTQRKQEFAAVALQILGPLMK
ncbi:MAG: extracellular solute-binding protein [Chloroflexi bacterium]|nr:extracellular solute-binding protein [Chloroflexota bacterium]